MPKLKARHIVPFSEAAPFVVTPPHMICDEHANNSMIDNFVKTSSVRIASKFKPTGGPMKAGFTIDDEDVRFLAVSAQKLLTAIA